MLKTIKLKPGWLARDIASAAEQAARLKMPVHTAAGRAALARKEG